MQNSSNLHNARRMKNDEFYTLEKDIDKELKHYYPQLAGKVIYCNCDNPGKSKFWSYLKEHFHEIRYAQLWATYYMPGGRSIFLGFDGNVVRGKILRWNGDFRSRECMQLLERADVIISNPPFSLFKTYLQTLLEYKKKFLVIGNMNAAKYKTIFPYFMNNLVWFGYNEVHHFIVPDGSQQKLGNVLWYTNLDVDYRNQKIPLTKNYSEAAYQKYDSYDAIDVSKIKDIPMDYDGIIGVPISFLRKYNPEQFEIVGEFNHGQDSEFDLAVPAVNGKEKYTRIAIRRRM